MVAVDLLYPSPKYEHGEFTVVPAAGEDERVIQSIVRNTQLLFESAAERLRMNVHIRQRAIHSEVAELLEKDLAFSALEPPAVTAVINPNEHQLRLLSLGRPRPDYPLLTIYSERSLLEEQLRIIDQVIRTPIISDGKQMPTPNIFAMYQSAIEHYQADTHSTDDVLVARVLKAVPA